MSKIVEMLAARRREIEAQFAPLKAELKEIDLALAAIEGRPPAPTQGKPRKPSVIDRIIELLTAEPSGLPTAEIAKRMKDQFGREVSNRNMSWHLSRLKRDGGIVQVDGLWRLPAGDGAGLLVARTEDETESQSQHGEANGLPDLLR